MRFESALGRTVRGFWATSYSFDLQLFDQYLLRRLAQNALNAVILIDHNKLASAWEQLAEGDAYLLRQAGRRYLLRGIRLQGGGAFHPKSYLLTRRDGATLLIGSGNLTRSGIDYGHEVFSTFTTERDDHLPTMRAWARWVGRLVHMQDDDLLIERWSALRVSCPWMTGSDAGSQLLTNESRSLADQLIDHLPAVVSELHITAPFFDNDARAVKRVIDAAAPGLLVLYLGAEASVHGPALRTVLMQSRDVRIRRFQPHVFVHAKLIAAVGEDGTGVLVSGSPNLSQAALYRTIAEPAGNCELAVIRSGAAEQLRSVFEASGLELLDVSLDSLVDLEVAADTKAPSRPWVIRSAAWRDDGRIQLACAPAQVPPGLSLWWDSADDGAAIGLDAITHEALTDRDPLPVLVALRDDEGQLVSNWALVDDPAALASALREPGERDARRPSELEGLEMLPLVRLVLWADEKLIFDPDDTPAFRRAEEAVAEIEGAEDPTTFWERYAAEELQYDPRVRSYQPLTTTGASALPVDELLRELEALLHSAPSAGAQRLLQALTGGEDTDESGAGRGAPWSMEARQRVRAYHLLVRWATAVGDPRHGLINPLAPVVNYETLLGLVFVAWVTDALQVVHARRLVRVLFDAFIGPAPGHGFLGRIDDIHRNEAIEALDEGFREIGAGLVYSALRVPNWHEDIYDWQPALGRGLELGVIRPGPLSEAVVLHLTGNAVAAASIGEQLHQRVRWIDDTTWCSRLAAELDLKSVMLGRFDNPKVRLRADISGEIDFLNDARVLIVARRASEYKQSEAIALFVGDDRLIFIPDQPARIVLGGIDGKRYTTDGPIDTTHLRAVEEQGGTISDLFSLGRLAKAA
jgi:hypothetical protein